MNVIVRFYWQHDIDLVALNKHPDFDMGRWMKKAVIAYAREDKDFSIPLPRPMPYTVDLDNCCTHFRLTPGKDDDVIEFLNGIRSGLRNSTIKRIFSNSLEGLYIAPFLNSKTFNVKSRAHNVTDEKVAQKILEREPIKPKAEIPKVAKTTKSKEAVQLKEATTTKPQPTPNQPPKPKPEPVMDLSNEESNLDDGDSFDLFGAVNKMM